MNRRIELFIQKEAESFWVAYKNSVPYFATKPWNNKDPRIANTSTTIKKKNKQEEDGRRRGCGERKLSGSDRC